MKLNTPRWWYSRDARHGRVLRTLLSPVSALYARESRRRLAQKQGIDPGVPVISVGNLTVGGSGKTPVAREILNVLAKAGVDGHAVSRGYGGKEIGPLMVDPDVHRSEDVGDEPLMLAAQHPVWVARDRAEGAMAAVEAGAETLVLDDAHKNPSVKKTLSIVVVDGETRDGEWPFGDGAVFPSGPMREPLEEGLARADAVVILLPSDVPEADPELLKLFGGLPVLIARLTPLKEPTEPPDPKVGFAGVGKPWKVERAMKAAGIELKEFCAYPDHGAYTDADLRRLQGLAERHSAALITTEKDWVRLPPAWRPRIEAWPVRARFDDEAALMRLLKIEVKD